MVIGLRGPDIAQIVKVIGDQSSLSMGELNASFSFGMTIALSLCQHIRSISWNNFAAKFGHTVPSSFVMLTNSSISAFHCGNVIDLLWHSFYFRGVFMINRLFFCIISIVITLNHSYVCAITYTIHNLGTINESDHFSEGVDINNLGWVSGYTYANDSQWHAFLHNGLTINGIGTIGGSIGAGINDSGWVTGSYNLNIGYAHAFLYKNSNIIDLGTLGGNRSHGFSVNNSGLVTGYSEIDIYGKTHAFLYNGVNIQDIGTLGGFYSSGYGINDLGWITGSSSTSSGETHAFLYKDTNMHDLGTLGGNRSAGMDINTSGWITGDSYTSTGMIHAFLYNGLGMIDLGTLGMEYSFGTGINDSGWVTGYAFSSAGVGKAFLYLDGVMCDLMDLLVAGHGWTSLYRANSINNLGQITGVGIIDGKSYAFLATPVAPVPEPSTALLLGMGLSGIALAGRTMRKKSL